MPPARSDLCGPTSLLYGVAVSEISLRERIRDLFQALGPGAEDAIAECRELYADDLRFEDPMQVTTTLEAFIATTERLVRRARELSFTVASIVGTDDEFCLTWTMTFAPKVGPLIEVDGVSHFRARDGRVVHQRDFWDLATLFASALPGGRTVLRTVLRPFT